MKFLCGSESCLRQKPPANHRCTAWLTPVALISLSPLFINCFFSPLSPPLTPLRSSASYSNCDLQERGRVTDAMGNGGNVPAWWVAALVVVCCAVDGVVGHLGGEEGEGEGRERGLFLMQEYKQVVKTDAGEMRVVRKVAGAPISEKPMQMGFITMEPKSLFVPQYLDSSLILFVRRGISYLSLSFSGLAYFDNACLGLQGKQRLGPSTMMNWWSSS